jgi:hypothetical protein
MARFSDIVAGFASRETQKVERWWLNRMVIIGAIALCGLVAVTGLTFLAYAAYISLLDVVTPSMAGVIVGCILLVLSLLGALGTWLWARHIRKQEQQPRQTTISPSVSSPPGERQVPVDTITIMGETIGASLNKNGIRTFDVMIAALVAGTVLGASPALRHRLRQRRFSSRTTPSAKREYNTTRP